MARPILNINELKEKFYYYPDTGALWRRVDNDGAPYYRIAGTEYRGRLSVGINKKGYQVHRIVWALYYGEDPVQQIDHINGNPSDNRICNLRLADTKQNMGNLRRATKRSSTGLLGVCKRAKYTRYQATIQVDGKQINLGMYETAEEAHQAYLKAKRKLHEYCTI